MQLGLSLVVTGRIRVGIDDLLRGECQEGSNLFDRDMQPHVGLRWTAHAVQGMSIQDSCCVGPPRHGPQHSNSRRDGRIWPPVGSPFRRPLPGPWGSGLSPYWTRPDREPGIGQWTGIRKWLTAAIRDRPGATLVAARPPRCRAARVLACGVLRPARPNEFWRPRRPAGRRAP